MADPVDLGEIQETLLIPLYGRAKDAEAADGILGDSTAIDLVAAIDYDFEKFRGPSLGGSVLRAAIFDEYVRDFLREHPDGTVVDLGCGLSTRFRRLDNGSVRWFDLDVPDTMALRRRYFEDTERYTMIAGSIFDENWWDVVSVGGGPILLISEAVLLYFEETMVHDLLRRLSKRFPGTRFAVDTGGATMMKTQDSNPVFRVLSARMVWTCRDPASLEELGIRLLESRTFATPGSAVAQRMSPKSRFLMTVLGRFAPPVRTYKMNLFEL
ncbi:class I SAM-dependent methyltransferase [Gordonia humi]|uniref:O-methyltransferase involved in polyketide biosynthesis n=1 Tax=Gordonia humi TaxID=686429 RepID=A0A840F9G1_9ACTN|nr:class I SAM-dependent methyltransferase [Gordonia humi]MBB4136800.1 O-methyltransferase involved in polyketide biosynthesis [Gordonia humi]